MEENNKCCSKCGETKLIDKFYKGRSCCKDCSNEERRNKYKTDLEYQNKIKETGKKYKEEKTTNIRKKKEELQKEITERIGIDNQICPYCNEVRPKTNFRHNRLKCIECEKVEGRDYRRSDFGKEKSKEWLNNNQERMTELQSNWFQNNKSLINEKNKIRMKTDPIFKFLKLQRRRCSIALEKKQKKTVEYLGCNGLDFYGWLSYNFNDIYQYNNHGTVWHIDHVIPISTFNLKDPTQQLLCFNWRNTVPLTTDENLSKNNRIIPQQVEQHYKKLLLYHQEKNIKMPQEFIDLFMQHLQNAGNP
jgi:uncharacterized protein (DUF983 family)